LPWQRGSVGKKCDWQHSIAHPKKLLYRRKNLAKISYASRVIAHFVPNFVAMATTKREKTGKDNGKEKKEKRERQRKGEGIEEKEKKEREEKGKGKGEGTGKEKREGKEK